MSRWNQYRLVDILCSVDPALLEEEIPESDLERFGACPDPEAACGAAEDLGQEEAGIKRRRRRIALISGLAAGSVALTGVAVLAFRKKDVVKRIA